MVLNHLQPKLTAVQVKFTDHALEWSETLSNPSGQFGTFELDEVLDLVNKEDNSSMVSKPPSQQYSQRSSTLIQPTGRKDVLNSIRKVKALTIVHNKQPQLKRSRHIIKSAQFNTHSSVSSASILPIPKAKNDTVEIIQTRGVTKFVKL